LVARLLEDKKGGLDFGLEMQSLGLGLEEKILVLKKRLVYISVNSGLASTFHRPSVTSAGFQHSLTVINRLFSVSIRCI